MFSKKVGVNDRGGGKNGAMVRTGRGIFPLVLASVAERANVHDMHGFEGPKKYEWR